MSRIEALTATQQAALPEYAQRWTAIGLSTTPANRQRAESGIRAAYAAAKLPPPRIVWCASPLANALTRTIVVDSVRDSVWASVGASVWDSVRDSVRDSVGASVWASVWASVGASVGGQHDAHWIGFYAFFRDACGLTTQTEPLQGIRAITESAGWWLPHQRICWVSERHNVLRRDEQGRLHADGEPALAYPDGWALYRYHGVTIPDEWGQRKAATWDSAWLLIEENAERRRALLQGIGYDRIAHDLGATRVHKQRDMELLLIAKDVDVEPIVMLAVVCPSTGHRHVLRVPPGMRNCETARRWTLGYAGDEAKSLTFLAET